MSQEKDSALDLLQAVWEILDQTGSEAWVHDLVRNSIKSWKASKR